jgi:hypothetical protein
MQEEADTCIILHCVHTCISENSSTYFTIVTRSPDTDVFILLLKYVQKIQHRVLFETGVGNKRCLIDIHRVIDETEQDLCLSLPRLHSFCGCDTTVPVHLLEDENFCR